MRSAPFSVVRRTLSGPRFRGLTCASITFASGVALAVSAAPASAAVVSADAAPRARAHIAATYGEAQTILPGTQASAAREGSVRGSNWLIGASGDRRKLARIAAEHGGRFNATIGVLSVPRAAAKAVTRELGTRTIWAGPNVTARRSSSFDQPANVQSPWSRSVADAPSLTPPTTSLATIGVVDDAVDHSVAELASADVINGVTPIDSHGTMVASTAAAPYDGAGVVGVAPGATVLSWGGTPVGVKKEFTCEDITSGVIQLVKRGARVINLSLGFDQNCDALWNATAYAYANNVAIVAAAGNDGDEGNPLAFPASYPHVITAAALDQSLTIASFSNYNDYVDIAAPGVGVPVDLPLRFDTKDGRVDGTTTVDGTSFSSPFVAGGISWILGARPLLDPSQVAAVLRLSSKDLELPGWDPYSGYGLLQVTAALAVPTPPADALEPNDLPAFTKARNKGTFSKPNIWSGGAAAYIQATGDSSDDAVDAYRIKVPRRSSVKISLKASEGYVNLFAFNSSVSSFNGNPVDASAKRGMAKDTIRLRNDRKSAQTAFVVVNTVADSAAKVMSGVRTQSRYVLKVSR
jgi:hypothetical protein